MKKALLIISISVFALAGCSSDKKESSKSDLKAEFKKNQLEMLTGLQDDLDSDTKEAYSNYVDCYADAIFKALPDKTIEKFKNIDASSGIKQLGDDITEKEQKKIIDAATSCASELYQ